MPKNSDEYTKEYYRQYRKKKKHCKYCDKTMRKVSYWSHKQGKIHKLLKKIYKKNK